MRISETIRFFLVFAAWVTLTQGCAHSQDFRPLAESETLSYETQYDAKNGHSVLEIFRNSGAERRLLNRLEGLACNKVLTSANGKKLFFLVNDPSSSNSMPAIWIADGTTGTIRLVFGSKCSFAISPDGRFVCGAIRGPTKVVEWSNKKGQNVLDVPAIKVVDLGSGETRVYDYSKGFLSNQWGATALVKFNSSVDSFEIKFVTDLDPPTLGEVSVSVPDLTATIK